MFWGGHTRTFFAAFSLFSCLAFSFLSCPLVPSSFFSSHALCVALGRALLVLQSMLADCPLLLLLALPFSCPFPLRTHACTLCLFGARTEAPLPTHALCHLLFPCSLVPLVPLLPCVCSLPYSTLASHSPFHCLILMCDLLLLSLCIMSHAIYLFTRWVVDFLYSATPKSMRVVLMHS